MIHGWTLLLTLILLAADTVAVDGQVRRGRAQEVARWAPVAVGIRAGWDQRARQEVLGAQIRIPVVRSGTFEIVPSTDVTFIPTERDYQYAVEAAWVSGDARGGLFVSAGAAWRSTTVTAEGRETFFGYVIGVGGKSPVGPVQVELGLRWTFLNDTTYRPNLASLGVNLPLWSVERGQGLR